MKKLIGVDCGDRKTGIAISFGSLAQPFAVVRSDKAVKRIKSLIEKEKVDAVIVGISENVQAENAKRFGESLSRYVKIPILFWDETLTTQEAQKLSLEAGIKRSKRKNLEDAYAAALLLQSFLDSRKAS